MLPLPLVCFHEKWEEMDREPLGEKSLSAMQLCYKSVISSGSGDVTALRCSEPLRSKDGGASKP